MIGIVFLILVTQETVINTLCSIYKLYFQHKTLFTYTYHKLCTYHRSILYTKYHSSVLYTKYHRSILYTKYHRSIIYIGNKIGFTASSSCCFCADVFKLREVMGTLFEVVYVCVRGVSVCGVSVQCLLLLYGCCGRVMMRGGANVCGK